MSEVTDLLDAVVAKYENQRTVDESAKTLLSGLSQIIRDQAGTIVANNEANRLAKENLIALADKVDADTASMADAVTANTPSA